jgi:Mrp family chromosome partitioning ATPase
MAVLKGRSRLPQVKEAARRLKRVRAKVLGLVVSGVPHDGYGYGYSYNYHGHANGRAESTGQAATV